MAEVAPNPLADWLPESGGAGVVRLLVAVGGKTSAPERVKALADLIRAACDIPDFHDRKRARRCLEEDAGKEIVESDIEGLAAATAPNDVLVVFLDGPNRYLGSATEGTEPTRGYWVPGDAYDGELDSALSHHALVLSLLQAKGRVLLLADGGPLAGAAPSGPAMLVGQAPQCRVQRFGTDGRLLALTPPLVPADRAATMLDDVGVGWRDGLAPLWQEVTEGGKGLDAVHRFAGALCQETATGVPEPPPPPPDGRPVLRRLAIAAAALLALAPLLVLPLQDRRWRWEAKGHLVQAQAELAAVQAPPELQVLGERLAKTRTGLELAQTELARAGYSRQRCREAHDLAETILQAGRDLEVIAGPAAELMKEHQAASAAFTEAERSRPQAEVPKTWKTIQAEQDTAATAWETAEQACAGSADPQETVARLEKAATAYRKVSGLCRELQALRQQRADADASRKQATVDRTAAETAMAASATPAPREVVGWTEAEKTYGKAEASFAEELFAKAKVDFDEAGRLYRRAKARAGDWANLQSECGKCETAWKSFCKIQPQPPEFAAFEAEINALRNKPKDKPEEWSTLAQQWTDLRRRIESIRPPIPSPKPPTPPPDPRLGQLAEALRTTPPAWEKVRQLLVSRPKLPANDPAVIAANQRWPTYLAARNELLEGNPYGGTELLPDLAADLAALLNGKSDAPLRAEKARKAARLFEDCGDAPAAKRAIATASEIESPPPPPPPPPGLTLERVAAALAATPPDWETVRLAVEDQHSSAPKLPARAPVVVDAKRRWGKYLEARNWLVLRAGDRYDGTKPLRELAADLAELSRPEVDWRVRDEQAVKAEKSFSHECGDQLAAWETRITVLIGLQRPNAARQKIAAAKAYAGDGRAPVSFLDRLRELERLSDDLPDLDNVAAIRKALDDLWATASGCSDAELASLELRISTIRSYGNEIIPRELAPNHSCAGLQLVLKAGQERSKKLKEIMAETGGWNSTLSQTDLTEGKINEVIAEIAKAEATLGEIEAAFQGTVATVQNDLLLWKGNEKAVAAIDGRWTKDSCGGEQREQIVTVKQKAFRMRAIVLVVSAAAGDPQGGRTSYNRDANTRWTKAWEACLEAFGTYGRQDAVDRLRQAANSAFGANDPSDANKALSDCREWMKSCVAPELPTDLLDRAGQCIEKIRQLRTFTWDEPVVDPIERSVTINAKYTANCGEKHKWEIDWGDNSRKKKKGYYITQGERVSHEYPKNGDKRWTITLSYHEQPDQPVSRTEIIEVDMTPSR